MAGGGYYPIMTNTEWANAPWNEPNIMYETCLDCNGDGGVWINADGDVLFAADYERLDEEERYEWEFEKCERCDGSGEIEVEPYEPDYDNYDD